MKKILMFAMAGLLGAFCAAQNQPAGQPAAAGQTATAPSLESVLALMDQTSKTFQTAQADFVWDQFDNVVKQHDVQAGTIYFRRRNGRLEMAARITKHDDKPQEKFVVYSDNRVQLWEPNINQVTQYSTAKNKSQFESFLVLGFGGSGADLKRNFDVSAAGSELVEGTRTAKLLLVPKDPKARNVFEKIYLWIDLQRGISLRQMFIEPNSGNYRDAVYRNPKLNQKIPDSNFKLKLPGNVKVVTPQG